MNGARPGQGHAGDGAREREHGPGLVQRLHGLMRALRLYDRGNQTVQGQLAELEHTLRVLLSERAEELLLLSLGGYFYLDQVRLRPTAAQAGLFRSLATEFAARGIAGVRARPGFTNAELEALLVLLSRPVHTKGPSLTQQADTLGLRNLVPVSESELGTLAPAASAEDEAALDERGRAQRVYQSALAGTERALRETARAGRPALQQARRVVQPLVDRIMKSEYSILGLAAIKDHDEYTYAHCVNVSVLSIRIGQVLGLSRQELASLGVAALLHDVGKVAVPADTLRKAGKLDDAEWAAIRQHPLEGFKLVCRLPQLSALLLEAAHVALEHHVTLDGRGYPAGVTPAQVSTSARIVAVADLFDAVTAHRAYRARPLTPYEALHLVLRVERAKFDPAAVWGLLQAVGYYPAGTVMEMDSGHLVVSVSPGGPDPRRPHCRVLMRPDGTLPEDDVPEYWDPVPAGDRVRRVIPPEEMDPGVTRAAA